MVEVRDLRGHLQQRRRVGREDVDRVGHVLLGEVALVADQSPGLKENAIGHREFADVVDARGLRQLRALDLREAHAAADRFGVERDAPAVIAGSRIAHVDGLDHRLEGRTLDREDGLRQRVLVGLRGAGLRHRFDARAAQRDQVARQRDEGHRIDRFVEKRRRTALERVALQLFVGRARDHHDRHRTVAAAAQLADEVDAAEFRHVLVDDDQRRIVGRAPGQRVARFAEADGFGLGNLRDDLREHREVGLDVVDHEDLGELVGVSVHATLARYAATAARSRS